MEISLCNSEDEYEILSLSDRILRAQQNEASTNHKKHSPPVHFPSKRCHMISDSDESDENDCNLPCTTLKSTGTNHTTSPLLHPVPDDPFEDHQLNLKQNNFVSQEVISSATFSAIFLSDTEKESNTKEITVMKKPRKPNKIDCTEKLLAKEEKAKLREEKKKEREVAKALKMFEKEKERSKKPEECLKAMKVIIDADLKNEENKDIFTVLREKDIQYVIKENPLDHTVFWHKSVYDFKVENDEVIKIESVEQENVLVIVIPNQRFLEMINTHSQRSKGKDDGQQTLLEYITNIKSLFSEMNITCVTIGFDKYLRETKDQGNDSNLKKMAKHVSKLAIEEVTVEIQLHDFINFNFLNNMLEFGEILYRFTKAISEAPQKREKQQQKSLAFSWYADADTSCPVKLEKDSSNFIKLWRQQIQQFQNVGPEVAEAIAVKYPSVRSLIQAYMTCVTAKEAEGLLQDIVVRRNYGPLGTQRRIGPELSYKIYMFYTSKNGDQVLQR